MQFGVSDPSGLYEELERRSGPSGEVVKEQEGSRLADKNLTLQEFIGSDGTMVMIPQEGPLSPMRQ